MANQIKRSRPQVGTTWATDIKLPTDELQRNLVDFICLLYHEARNVRHPINAGKLTRQCKYKMVMNLASNRYKAWKQMAKMRDKAASAKNVAEAARVFQEVYRLSLEELEELYKAPCWKHSQYGGNKWAPICFKVRELVETLSLGDRGRSAKLIFELRRMEHNTGTVEKKLRSLEVGCDGAAD